MNAEGDMFKQTKDISKQTAKDTTSKESLENIVDLIMEDEEIKEIASGIKDSDLKAELKVLLKKLIERFSKFKTEANDDYIG